MKIFRGELKRRGGEAKNENRVSRGMGASWIRSKDDSE